MSRAKKPPALDVARFEARMARIIGVIGAAVDDETLESQVLYARYVLGDGVTDGYSPIAAETWTLRIRRAAAEVTHRLNQEERPPKAFNDKGLDTARYRERLQRLLQVLNLYSPDELARELARLARAVDPRVLTEDEFQ